MKFQVNMLNSLGVMARTKNVDGRTDAHTDAHIDAHTDGQMDGQTDGDHYHIPPPLRAGG